METALEYFNNHEMYIVLAISLVVWCGIIIKLRGMEKKIKRLELVENFETEEPAIIEQIERDSFEK